MSTSSSASAMLDAYEAMRAKFEKRQAARRAELCSCLMEGARADVNLVVSTLHDHLMMCDSFSRFYEIEVVFRGVRHSRATSEIFWRNLHDFWTVCDGTDALALFRLMRRFKRGWRAEYMQPENLAAYNELPDLIKVWRGQDRDDLGLSWSTSRDVALHFAYGQRRICKSPTLLSGLAPKALVAGAFTDRNEHEVLLFHNDVQNYQVEDGPDFAVDGAAARMRAEHRRREKFEAMGWGSAQQMTQPILREGDSQTQ